MGPSGFALRPVTRFDADHLLANDAKLEEIAMSQLADFQPLPSRDALGPRHVVSRLLAQFETIRASPGHCRVTRFGGGHRRQSSQIAKYVYKTTKARQVVLTGLD